MWDALPQDFLKSGGVQGFKSERLETWLAVLALDKLQVYNLIVHELPGLREVFPGIFAGSLDLSQCYFCLSDLDLSHTTCPPISCTDFKEENRPSSA